MNLSSEEKTQAIKDLSKAMALINFGWCRGDYACTKDNKTTNAGNKDAISWCAKGALIATYHISNRWYSCYHNISWTLLNDKSYLLFNMNLVHLNDSSKNPEKVLVVYKEVIEDLKKL